MTWYLLAWVAWVCPRVPLVTVVLPGTVAERLACRPEVNAEPFDSLANARRRRDQLGPGVVSTISSYKGLRRLNHVE